MLNIQYFIFKLIIKISKIKYWEKSSNQTLKTYIKILKLIIFKDLRLIIKVNLIDIFNKTVQKAKSISIKI